MLKKEKDANLDFNKFYILSMSHPIIKKLEDKYKRSDLPEIRPGMIIRLVQKIKEGEKTRNQTIEGLVITKKHGQEIGSMITIRKIVSGVGIEWTIPLNAPQIEKIEIVKESRMRRSKLYYIRNKSQRQTRMKLKREIRQAKAIKLPKEEIVEEIAEE